MRLMKAGWNDPNWEAVVTCDGCGAILEVERADLMKVRVGTVSVSRCKVECECPECNNIICLSKEVRENAPEHQAIRKTRDQRLGAGL